MKAPWILALVLLPAAGFAAQTPRFPPPSGVPTCPRDTPEQLDDRASALAVARQINSSAGRYKKLHGMYPTWKELADTPPIRLRGDADVQWGSDEPMPDWRIHYVSAGNAYAFTLTGMHDRCGVAFVSDESGDIRDARELTPHYGVVPLGSR
jgi:hypothetical protein